MKLTTHLSLFSTLCLASGGLAQSPTPDMKAMSLYDRMGGIHKIAQVVSDWNMMSAKDEVMLKNETFSMAIKQYPASAPNFLMTGYIASKTGGPQKYMGPDMVGLHKAFMFTKDQNERCWMHFKMAAEKNGVATDAQKDFIAWWMKAEKSAKVVAIMPEPIMNPQSLYGRLGGIVPISLVVDEFINLLATDPVIGSNPNTVKALSSGRVTGAGLKYLVTEQLGEAAGGPWKYSGKTMAGSHKGLMISDKEWEVAAGLLKKVLDKYNVPTKEQGEVFSVIASTRGDIVGK